MTARAKQRERLKRNRTWNGDRQRQIEKIEIEHNVGKERGKRTKMIEETKNVGGRERGTEMNSNHWGIQKKNKC